jgi:hypothetical protein
MIQKILGMRFYRQATNAIGQCVNFIELNTIHIQVSKCPCNRVNGKAHDNSDQNGSKYMGEQHQQKRISTTPTISSGDFLHLQH